MAILCPALVADIPNADAMQASLSAEFKLAAIPGVPQPGNALARQWLQLATREIAGLRKQLKPWDQDPRARLLTTGLHTEHGIRPNTQSMIAFAVVARWGETEAERAAALADLVAMLRFVAPTHSAGPLLASDRKKWQNQWQSALWAFQAGQAAWLVWDRLDPDHADLRWLLANMIASEADRFVGKEPPFQIKNDTKAEENAWNSLVIALAATMFPQHPRSAQWHAEAVRWQLSSFLTEADARSNTIVDGKPLADWKLGANVHPDHTMENHDRVHPSYMATINMPLQQHLLYKWAGRKSPEALNWNAKPVYAHLKFFSHPDGRMHFPNGQDWELHRVSPGIHAMMSVLFNDAEAAYLERVSLETCQKMQARTGLTLLPQEYFFPSLPGMYAASYGQSFLLHATYGDGATPVSAGQFLKNQSSVRLFEHGQFIAQRTQHGWTSFSWGNRIMGQAIPFASDLLGSPHELGCVGAVTAEVAGGSKPKAEYPKLEQVKVERGEDRFSVSAALSRAGGAVGQSVAFVSLPDGSAVYIERLIARRAVKLTRLESGAAGVLNVPEWVYQDGPRKWQWEGGQLAVDGRKPMEPFTMQSRWANVDDRWGFIAVGADAWRYLPNDKAARGRREQFLFLAPPAATEYAAGQVIAERATITLLNRTAAQTAAASKTISGQFRDGKANLSLAEHRITADLNPQPPVVKVAPH